MAKEPFRKALTVAPTNLDSDSSAILKGPSSANVIVEMPGNIDDAPPRSCCDDSLGVMTLDEATQTVRDLLAGRSQEIKIVSSTDKRIRKAVAVELLASLSRPNIEEREHARRLFIDHGYLDDAIQELASTGPPNERAMAAGALGLIASPRGIMSLVGALLDDAPEVRHAAEQALAQISGPVVANLGALLEEELCLEAAEVVESTSTPTTVAFQETPFQNLTIEARMVEKPMSEATEVRESTICLEAETVQRAMQELKRRLLDAEDLTRKRIELVQMATQALEHRLLDAEDLTRKRIELETAQRLEMHAARCAEAEKALSELEEQHEKELAVLRSEVDEFQQALEVVAQKRAGVEEVRLETETQIRRFDEEKAELQAALETRRAGVAEVRLETDAQIRRFDEEKAELEAARETRRAGVAEMRLQTEAQIRRFDEEKAELGAAVEARRAGVAEVRLEAEAQIR
ncbi:MAG: HEAT repeat domain-containing protein, partial [Pyrinomonadaceae bacterium]